MNFLLYHGNNHFKFNFLFLAVSENYKKDFVQMKARLIPVLTILFLLLFYWNIDLPMLKIELSKIRFHGFHGVHEEETKTGGDFEVNMIVHFKPENIPVRHLDETIDYSQLY